MRRIAGLILSLFFVCPVFAQQNCDIARKNEFYSLVSLQVMDSNQINLLSGLIKYTSMKIEVQKPFSNSFHIGFTKPDGSQQFLLSKISEHADEGFEGIYSSALQIFETPQTALKINFGNFKGFVKIHLFYAPLTDNFTNNKLNKSTNRCEKPEMISYTVWRAGLPDPKPPREATKVEHLVVHHSAGNNSDTNYINIVRNIYLLHTQSNGWDDIGYNFIVAPNGLVFNGRDPQGVADDDNILGAHFCGKNSNTMGVCMLGNFMDVRPTPEALFSLKYLLAWKLKKDRIDALGQTKHPKPDGNLLNNICGHRDGCSTDCPGDSLYGLLPEIKAEAARIADSCGLLLDLTESQLNDKTCLYPNPCNGTVTLISQDNRKTFALSVFNSMGQLVFESKVFSSQTFDLLLPQGLYFYHLKENNVNSNTGILVIKN